MARRVLVVESDPLAFAAISAPLREAGYDVAQATGPRQVRWSFLERAPELVLVNAGDAIEPDLGVVTAFRELPEGASVPAIAVGFAPFSAALIAKLAGAGIERTLLLPTAPRTLLDVIATTLGGPLSADRHARRAIVVDYGGPSSGSGAFEVSADPRSERGARRADADDAAPLSTRSAQARQAHMERPPSTSPVSTRRSVSHVEASPPSSRRSAPPAHVEASPPSSRRSAPPAHVEASPTSSRPSAPPAHVEASPTSSRRSAPPAHVEASPPSSRPRAASSPGAPSSPGTPDEESAASYVKRGRRALAEERYHDARNLFVVAAKLEPSHEHNAYADVARGYVQRSEGNLAEALESARRALRAEKDFEPAKQLASLLEGSNKWLSGLFRRR